MCFPPVAQGQIFFIKNREPNFKAESTDTYRDKMPTVLWEKEQDRQYTHNVTMRAFVQPLLLWKNNMYYIYIYIMRVGL